MSGTVAGGKLTARKNRAKYGDDYYSRIGALGGSAKVPKGFAVSGKASEAGAIGGQISRRRKAIT